MTTLASGYIQKDYLLFLGVTAMNVTSLLALPFLRVNLMVKAEISLDTTGRSLNLKTAPAILIYLSAMVWDSVNNYLRFKDTNQTPPYELAFSVFTYLIIVTQIGTALLIFNVAVNWVLEENKAIDKATSSRDLLSAYTRLINKYRHLKDGSGDFLFCLCFYFGLILFGTAWVVTFFVRQASLLYTMPFVLMTLANFLLLREAAKKIFF